MTDPAAPNITRQAKLQAQRGQVAEAYRLLCAAEAEGDAQAALLLADWRMTGAVIRRDLVEARRLFGRASELGCDEATPIYIALLAIGAGGSGRYWSKALQLLAKRADNDLESATQLALLKAMALDSEGDPVSPLHREALHKSQCIERLPGFLTEAECRYVGAIAMRVLAPSVVVDPVTGQQRRDSVRTGWSASFPFVFEDPVLHAINRRIAAATFTDYSQGEPLQVLSYEAGQEYKLHSDALPAGGNQRLTTFLIGLTNDYDGGETDFPRLGLSVRLRRGDGLLFRNADASGRPAELMWHAGKPVTRGRKLLISKWIRATPLDLSGSPGRLF